MCPDLLVKSKLYGHVGRFQAAEDILFVVVYFVQPDDAGWLHIKFSGDLLFGPGGINGFRV
ncbi:hypothetical protein D3C80_1640370 [compost metagenome]